MALEPPSFWGTVFQDPCAAWAATTRPCRPHKQCQTDGTEPLHHMGEATERAHGTTFGLHQTAEAVRQETAQGVDPPLLIRPMIWWANRHMVDGFALPTGRFHVALAWRGQEHRCCRPVMVIRHEPPCAKPCGFQALQGDLSNRPRQAVGPFPSRVRGHLSHVVEVLAHPHRLPPLARAGGGTRATARFGARVVPLLQGVEACGARLVQAPHGAATPRWADAQHQRALCPPQGAATARDEPMRHGARPHGRRRPGGHRHAVGMLRGPQGGHSVHGEGLSQGVMGLGVLPCIVDAGAIRDLAHELLDPRPDGGEGVGQRRGIDLVPLIDRGREGHLPLTGCQQGATAWAQVRALRLRVAAWRQCRTGVRAGESGKKVRGVVAERLQRARTLVQHRAGPCRFERLQGRP